MFSGPVCEAGTITKALGKDKFEITWADGVQTDQSRVENLCSRLNRVIS